MHHRAVRACSTYYLLFTTYYSLLTANCSLLILLTPVLRLVQAERAVGVTQVELPVPGRWLGLGLGVMGRVDARAKVAVRVTARLGLG